MSIAQQAIILKQIIDMLKQNHRLADDITLCAVSKAQSAAAIKVAYQAGLSTFGENYVQEALKKQTELQACNIEWHFIGPIQSNKTQLIAQHFDWVQSVDRLKIAQRLSQARPQHLPELNVCLQINISQEASKSGISVDEVFDLASKVAQLPKLKLRGLMAIPAPVSVFEQQREQFKKLHLLFTQLKTYFPALDTLSMGMSDDYEAAIAEGSTMVRLGAALFGTRNNTEQL